MVRADRGVRNNNDHAMTTLPHAEHAIRKKSYAPHYTPANLALFQPEIHDLALKLTDVSRAFCCPPR